MSQPNVTDSERQVGLAFHETGLATARSVDEKCGYNKWPWEKPTDDELLMREAMKASVHD
ncbi:MAG: hypothetical protein JSS66_10790 [Armatimonadetes bacterium]|nr:hypothetical protein [Armatimonadota bacterium]